jgi:hypothetical protein
MSKKSNSNSRPAPRDFRADGWLTPEMAARKLGVTRNAILKRVATKGLPMFKVIGDPNESGVIHPDDLAAHLKAFPLGKRK